MFPFGQSLVAIEKGGGRQEGSGTALAYLKAGVILASEIQGDVHNLELFISQDLSVM